MNHKIKSEREEKRGKETVTVVEREPEAEDTSRSREADIMTRLNDLERRVSALEGQASTSRK